MRAGWGQTETGTNAWSGRLPTSQPLSVIGGRGRWTRGGVLFIQESVRDRGERAGCGPSLLVRRPDEGVGHGVPDGC